MPFPDPSEITDEYVRKLGGREIERYYSTRQDSDDWRECKQCLRQSSFIVCSLFFLLVFTGTGCALWGPLGAATGTCWVDPANLEVSSKCTQLGCTQLGCSSTISKANITLEDGLVVTCTTFELDDDCSVTERGKKTNEIMEGRRRESCAFNEDGSCVSEDRRGGQRIFAILSWCMAACCLCGSGFFIVRSFQLCCGDDITLLKLCCFKLCERRREEGVPCAGAANSVNAVVQIPHRENSAHSVYKASAHLPPVLTSAALEKWEQTDVPDEAPLPPRTESFFV